MKRFPRASVSPLLPIPAHLGIIMDGNGRWAKRRGMPRTMGHREGAQRIKQVVNAAIELGIAQVTLFTFSTENWNRPKEEVDFLFSLVPSFFRDYEAELTTKNVKVRIIGFLNELPATVVETLQEVERRTATSTGLILNLAFNYGGHRDLVHAAKQVAAACVAGLLQPEHIDETTFAKALCSRELPPLDLVLRTSNEQRLSNFLPWQSAYAELMFLEVLWPDVSKATIYEAVANYQTRNRRFGGV